jgi:hypothetical protein
MTGLCTRKAIIGSQANECGFGGNGSHDGNVMAGDREAAVRPEYVVTANDITRHIIYTQKTLFICVEVGAQSLAVPIFILPPAGRHIACKRICKLLNRVYRHIQHAKHANRPMPKIRYKLLVQLLKTATRINWFAKW